MEVTTESAPQWGRFSGTPSRAGWSGFSLKTWVHLSEQGKTVFPSAQPLLGTNIPRQMIDRRSGLNRPRRYTPRKGALCRPVCVQTHPYCTATPAFFRHNCSRLPSSDRLKGFFKQSLAPAAKARRSRSASFRVEIMTTGTPW